MARIWYRSIIYEEARICIRKLIIYGPLAVLSLAGVYFIWDKVKGNELHEFIVPLLAGFPTIMFVDSLDALISRRVMAMPGDTLFSVQERMRRWSKLYYFLPLCPWTGMVFFWWCIGVIGAIVIGVIGAI